MKFRIFKKHNQKIVLLSLTTLFLLSSCDKEILSPVSETAISDANAFDTPTRIEQQINGLYSTLKSGQFYGGRYLIYNDIRGEEFINRLDNLVTGKAVWSLNVESGRDEVNNLWATAYSTINRVNVFLKGLDDNAAKIDPTLLASYRGEAKLIRALTYYSLLQLYAKPFTLDNGASLGVPLRLLPESTGANNDLVRSTVAQVYTQILLDLNEAEPGLPSTYSTALLNTTRAHKNTAIALKTRVYLTMGRYADVITEGNKLVPAVAPYRAPTGVLHQLQASVATPYTNYTTVESIMSMPMTDANPPGTQNQLGYYFNKAGSGFGNGEYYLNTASAGILNNPLWPATDARKTNFITVSGGQSYLIKYNKTSPFADYVPVIRYAEVLLNLAEANARTSVTPSLRAIALLNAVRQRSDATYNFDPTNLATPAALINTILTERRIELIGEGFRSIDLLRTNQTIPGKISPTEPVNAVAPTEKAYIWPIPINEIRTNTLIVPN
ncbi:RagB/SusD family nutrient uptake outer membrane protein [Pedobacter cryophilus]|uniref:RagB/SusD family nutrient uptake outer membrane protein n=1 Tax=Pedobacter cryophilus TaxID=2571271 RepID=A0A4U1C6S6_9SPHI|nr:RagB/SusD family nutrient uptake outer membrane protein [Pedobacter cryophilus]TKC00344.1 RagB/SusD family nutrient uptake outer membrane protein [Pedobacter cryophilus]